MQRQWSASLSAAASSLAFLACAAWGDDATIEHSAPAPAGLEPTSTETPADATDPAHTEPTAPTEPEPADPPPPSEGPEPASSGVGPISEPSGGSSGTAPPAQDVCQQPDAASIPACAEPMGSPPPQLLPDLVIDGQYLTATIQQDFVDAAADTCLFSEGCVTGTGLRRVIRFGTRSGNIGTADLVAGKPNLDNPLWEFDACHQHFHFEGYAKYSLIDSSSGVVLPIGVKNGFCLRDQETWDPALAAGNCAAYDCDFQGLSLGCADVYRADLDCQWVDITGLPAGPYELIVTVNSEQSIDELSLANNSASVRVQIEAETLFVLP